ncbi:MAG TPA: hypothetical protein VFF68_15105 [Anaerolineaceae bacterium]|nr:hypothetical protein [Anaerolineaceae bacterium]
MIDRVREQLRVPWVVALAGAVGGLILGMLIGWVIWPVQWTNAEPLDLREDIQVGYLCTAIDSYIRHGDQVEARARYQGLGESADIILGQIRPGTCNLSEGDITQFQAAVLEAPLTVPGEASVDPIVEVEEEAPAGPVNVGLIVGLCLVTLLVGAGLVYLLVFRNRRPVLQTAGGVPPVEYARPAAQTDLAPEAQEAPVAQYMTTYIAGDDLYDDSFSIDSPSGEFLGECGVGIAETIGVGDPKKVAAFEVWLFDKNDIQTITKVLMSEHAYNDPQIRQRLASKGEPVLLEPDKHILLETATLQLEARVVDQNYGQGALPDHSFIDRLTLELAVWPKNEA